MSAEQPLIWTSKGNMPIDKLEYQTFWHDTPDVLKFVERYSFEGEVVRESAHVFVKKGLVVTGEQGVM